MEERALTSVAIEGVTKSTVPPGEVKRRAARIGELDSTYTATKKDAAKTLRRLEQQADHHGKIAVGTGGVGIAAGIAAGALVVASPANAVWVAALTGVGTGALSFQTRMALEGFSRDAVAQVYNDTITRMREADGEYLAAIKVLISHKEDWAAGKWDAEEAKAAQALGRFSSAASIVPLPAGSAEVESLKQKNVELNTKIEELQRKVEELSKP